MQTQPACPEDSVRASSPRREPVSAFIIAYNEEEKIADCIRSVSFCDEVVVVDSFSTDRTAEIAESCGAKVIKRPWPGYREQKTFALASTSNDWVLNLDADERVSAELRESILRVLERDFAEKEASSHTPSVVNGYQVNRVVYFLGRWWRSGGWYPEYRLRLMRKSCTTWGGENPHERPVVEGKVQRLDGELQHYTYDSLADQISRLNQFSSIAAESEYQKGTKASLWLIFGSPLVRMFKFYFLKQGFREGLAGVVVVLAEGFYSFMKYAKLWEIERFREVNLKQTPTGTHSRKW